MKKTLILSSILAACGAGQAVAASSITLYGVADGGVEIGRTRGDVVSGLDAWSIFVPFIRPPEVVNPKTKVQMKSGVRDGSRWGIKGVEGIGGGNAVGFVLEQGYDLNNGTESSAGSAFSRETQLYVTGSFGKLGFGRFGTLSSGAGSYSILSGWALGTSYGMGSWNAFEGTLRANNSVAYVSPSFRGLTLHAMYSNGIGNDDRTWGKTDHYYGLGAKFTGSRLTTSLSFEVRDNKGGVVALTDYLKSNPNYQVNMGAEYSLRSAKLMLGYRYEWQSQYAKTHTVGLSAKANLDSATALMLGTRYYYAKSSGALKNAFQSLGAYFGYAPETKGSVLTFNAAIEHAFSKRTTAYMYGSYADGAKGFKSDYNMYIQALQLLGGAGISDPINFNGWQFGIGLTHAF